MTDRLDRRASFRLEGVTGGDYLTFADALRTRLTAIMVRSLRGVVDEPEALSPMALTEWVRQAGCSFDLSQDGVDVPSTALYVTAPGSSRREFASVRFDDLPVDSGERLFVIADFVLPGSYVEPLDYGRALLECFESTVRSLFPVSRRPLHVSTGFSVDTILNYTRDQSMIKHPDCAVPEWAFCVRERLVLDRCPEGELWQHVAGHIGDGDDALLMFVAPFGPFHTVVEDWDRWHAIVAPVTVAIDWSRLHAAPGPFEAQFGTPPGHNR